MYDSDLSDNHGTTAGSAKSKCRLYHVFGGVQIASAKQAQLQTTSHHQGMLRVQHQNDDSSRYVQFEDSRGTVMGALETNEHGHGVVLRSLAGDMAEWHPRLPHEPPFEEGDIVG